MRYQAVQEEAGFLKKPGFLSLALTLPAAPVTLAASIPFPLWEELPQGADLETGPLPFFGDRPPDAAPCRRLGFVRRWR